MSMNRSRSPSPAPAIPYSGKPARPKIKTRASATLTAVPAASIPSTTQVWPRPEKKPLIAAIPASAAPRSKTPQVNDLKCLQGRRMPADRDQVRGHRDHEQKQQPGHDREMNPLPDGRPDSLRAGGAGVLRDERRHVSGGHLEQPEHQPEPHDRRKRRRHLARIVPGEQDRINEDLDGHEALADNQGKRQREQLPAAAPVAATSRASARPTAVAGGCSVGGFFR